MPPAKFTVGASISIPKGTVLFSQGDPGKEMFVIVSGKVRIFIAAGDRELTLATLKRGDFFGEMSLLENLPRSACVEALADTELLSLAYDDFIFLIQQHPEIAMKVLARFSSRLRDADYLIELLLLGESCSHVIHFLVMTASSECAPDSNPSEWRVQMDAGQIARELEMPEFEVESALQELARTGQLVCCDNQIAIKNHSKLKYYIEYLEKKKN